MRADLESSMSTAGKIINIKLNEINKKYEENSPVQLNASKSIDKLSIKQPVDLGPKTEVKKRK